MQGEMNYWNNKHYITVCFDKLEPYKCHLKKLRDIFYTLDYKPNSTAAFKLIKKQFSFDVPQVPPLKTHQVYNMMQLLFSSTPAIRVEELMFMDKFFSFFFLNKYYLLMDEKYARLKMCGII